jgi:hypothetical protein
MQGCKAGAKTPTAALLFDIWTILNFEAEDQGVRNSGHLEYNCYGYAILVRNI